MNSASDLGSAPHGGVSFYCVEEQWGKLVGASKTNAVYLNVYTINIEQMKKEWQKVTKPYQKFCYSDVHQASIISKPRILPPGVFQ